MFAARRPRKAMEPSSPETEFARPTRYSKLNRLGRILKRYPALASRAASRGGSGREAQDDATEALRDAHREFVESVSHELRTPLTSLTLSVQLLRHLAHSKRIEKLSQEDLNRIICTADRQIDRLKALTDVFMGVSLMKAEALELHPEETDLGKLVEEEVDRLRVDPRLKARSIDATFKGNLRGYWDRTRLRQALRSLLDNAVVYGLDGPISVAVCGSSDAISVSVRDGGIGVAPADHERIFEPFQRGVKGERYNGMGLGLYMAREIAHAHRGEISVRSREGRGACFVLRVPRKRYPALF
jgi:signal transduction histidine kinase